MDTNTDRLVPLAGALVPRGTVAIAIEIDPTQESELIRDLDLLNCREESRFRERRKEAALLTSARAKQEWSLQEGSRREKTKHVVTIFLIPPYPCESDKEGYWYKPAEQERRLKEDGFMPASIIELTAIAEKFGKLFYVFNLAILLPFTSSLGNDREREENKKTDQEVVMWEWEGWPSDFWDKYYLYQFDPEEKKKCENEVYLALKIGA